MVTLTCTLTITDIGEINQKLLELSKLHGGAWVYSSKPFTSEVLFIRFTSPCRVPDEYQDRMWRTEAKLAYKGKLQPFTRASRIREQNRGLGCQ